MIKMARVAGRMTGRAVGRLMLYRRQMDDIFEQTAAKKINTELQDAMSKLQSIGYEVQNLSRITPGQYIKRQHNTEGPAEAGTYDGSAPKQEEFRDEIRNMIRDEIQSFCRKNPDQFTRSLDNPDAIKNPASTAEARKLDITDRSTMATYKDMESADTSSTNLHRQAMMYARLSESPEIKMSSLKGVSCGEQFKESGGLLNVLPISAESAGLLPSRTVLCFFPDRISKWCCEIRRVLRLFFSSFSQMNQKAPTYSWRLFLKPRLQRMLNSSSHSLMINCPGNNIFSCFDRSCYIADSPNLLCK